MAADLISLLCPTRGRPGNVARMVASARETAAGPVEFVFRADVDAPGSVPGEVAAAPDVTVVFGPRVTLSALWNECHAAASGDIFMQCDDEAVFRSAGWDAQVAAAFAAVPDRIAFVHGRDGHQPDGTFGTLGFLHRRWTDAVGYFTPPYFSCDYGDTWLNDVANALGRRVYLPGVVTEHMHPVAGKAGWDVTHLERLSRGSADNVAGLYASLGAERDADVARLRAVMS